MKKCPTCDKTFDDNLKFCQVDGTALVDGDPPPDPFKTMVQSQADLPAEVTDQATPAPGPAGEEDAEEVVLEVPDNEEDPMKTMVVTGDTSANVGAEARDAIPKEAERDSGESDDELELSPPKPPKFKEPDLSPPDLGGDEVASAPDPVAVPDPDPTPAVPPPSPFAPADDSESDVTPSAPIPSPLDKSMPPGFAPPSTPPFDPGEPVKAEKVASAAPPTEGSSIDLPDEISPPPAPVGEWKAQDIGGGVSAEVSDPPTEGQNKTLAIVSLATGILSMTLCCGIGIIPGLAAVVTGFMAKGKISQSPEEYGGGTFALIGMITGVLGTIIFIGIMIFQIFFGALANFL